MEFIDLKTQYQLIKNDIDNEIRKTLESSQYILGPQVEELEQNLALYVGVKHAIGVADGSKALLIALMALGIGAGDEVIMPSFTFVATASMPHLLGIKPIFVDIDPKTYNIDHNLIERAITAKTKAIIPVSLFGQCADMDSINAIANKYKLAVIEDGAQSFGAEYKNRKSCALSTIGCTSFFPSKPLGCYGDGGACFTNDDDLAAKIQQIRIHGQDRRYHHATLGVNGRLDTIQAAVLLAKLRIFDREVALRSKIGERYHALLTDALGEKLTALPVLASYTTNHVYGQYTIRIKHSENNENNNNNATSGVTKEENNNNRNQVIAKLKQAGIPSAIHYPIPLHQQPLFSQYRHIYSDGALMHSIKASQEVLSLPMHPYLEERQQDYIVKCLKEIVTN